MVKKNKKVMAKYNNNHIGDLQKLALKKEGKWKTHEDFIFLFVFYGIIVIFTESKAQTHTLM